MAATARLPEGGTIAQQNNAPSLAAILAIKHPIYEAQIRHWEREERRLYGQDRVLDELVRFDWEEEGGAHYEARQRQATYINLPEVHASLITGHVSKKRPKPGAGLSFGALGEVRTKEKLVGTPSAAEMFYYNVDGIGQDSSRWDAWWDGASKRAEATGHRWIHVEVPRRDRRLEEEITVADEMAGFRPFLIEHSPTRVTNWWHHNGELQFAVMRLIVDEPIVGKEDGILWMPQMKTPGYYLMVREGCRMLGDRFAAGGWWVWSSTLELIDEGNWAKTGGRIPLFPLFAEMDPGTFEHPTISRSQTMELGQIAIGLMNQISARDFDYFDAAQSKTFVSGADPSIAQTVISQLKSSQVVFIPPRLNEDGSVSQPVVTDGSQGAVTAEISKTIIEAKLEEAKMIMIEKATSSIDSSGSKQVASFDEASSPTLVRRAALRSQAETNAINFAEQRWGKTKNPTGYSEYPDNYALAPLVNDIDAQLDTIRRSGASSPSFVTGLVMAAADERGVMPEDVPRDTIKAELLQSLEQKAAQLSAAADARTKMLQEGLDSLSKPPKAGAEAPKADLPPAPAAGANSPPNPQPAKAA
jgi:hypothetical protein